MSSFFYVPYAFFIYSIWFLYVHNVHHSRFMITSDTPYKLAEVIRDTWPNLYRPSTENKKGNTNQDKYSLRAIKR